MVILSNIQGFDWDKGNLDKNAIKHRVTNVECEEVFFHQPIIVSKDTKHSKSEKRYHALGVTSQDRYLFLSFTIRTKLIRVISARDMNKKERKAYVKQK
jgi:uncharacterized protein